MKIQIESSLPLFFILFLLAFDPACYSIKQKSEGSLEDYKYYLTGKFDLDTLELGENLKIHSLKGNIWKSKGNPEETINDFIDKNRLDLGYPEELKINIHQQGVSKNRVFFGPGGASTYKDLEIFNLNIYVHFDKSYNIKEFATYPPVDVSMLKHFSLEPQIDKDELDSLVVKSIKKELKFNIHMPKLTIVLKEKKKYRNFNETMLAWSFRAVFKDNKVHDILIDAISGKIIYNNLIVP
jgi:hypothetical protein